VRYRASNGGVQSPNLVFWAWRSLMLAANSRVYIANAPRAVSV